MKKFKYYQVSTTAFGEHQGYTYRTSKSEAEREKQTFLDMNRDDKFADATVREIEVEPTKRGILNALLVHASHPDNG
jgi:hypothetical protein